MLFYEAEIHTCKNLYLHMICRTFCNFHFYCFLDPRRSLENKVGQALFVLILQRRKEEQRMQVTYITTPGQPTLQVQMPGWLPQRLVLGQVVFLLYRPALLTNERADSSEAGKKCAGQGATAVSKAKFCSLLFLAH